jgi:hypothetical protein
VYCGAECGMVVGLLTEQPPAGVPDRGVRGSREQAVGVVAAHLGLMTMAVAADGSAGGATL